MTAPQLSQHVYERLNTIAEEKNLGKKLYNKSGANRNWTINEICDLADTLGCEVSIEFLQRDN